MSEVIVLGPADRGLLAARYAEHGNSHRRMAAALREAGAEEPLERLRALRALECRFAIDLGSLCHRFDRRDQPGTHPLERMVLSYIAQERRAPDGRAELWVLLDRVRDVRAWIEEGRLVREPE